MIDVNLIGAPAFALQVVNDRFIYVGVNRRMGDLTGLSPQDVIGRDSHECWPPDLAEAVNLRYRQCVAARQAIDSESYYDLPGGGRWWHVTLTPVLDAKGGVSSLVGVATDITDRKAAERDRRKADARMALAMDVLDGGFWHLDVVSGDVEISPKLAGMVAGRESSTMTWSEITAAIHPDDLPGIDVEPMRRGEIESATVEYRVAPEGTTDWRWFRSRRRLMRSDTGLPERIIGVVLDVTEQKRLQALYERQARTDPLTGLANRRGFESDAADFLQKLAGEGSHFGLVLLDLDEFKPINDRFGHAAGDVVLRELATRLRGLVRPDDVVVRLGGDEFAILVSNIEGDRLTDLAQRLVLAMKQPVATGWGDLSIGVSVGVSASSDHDDTIADLAARADRALYEVKLSGRGTWRIAA